MTTLVSIENTITSLLERGKLCKSEMPDDILRNITSIKTKCNEACQLEASESSLQSWRNKPSKDSWRSGSGSGSSSGQSQYVVRNSRPIGFRPSNDVKPVSDKPVAPHVYTGPVRYVSKFQNSENSGVEDKILNNIILSKLNKFSTVNYDEVKAFLQQILDSDEKAFLKDFMALVFKKAACETTFCPLYARMLSELSSQYTTLVSEIMTLYDSYLDIFDEITEDQCKDYEVFVKRNREKAYRLGYSQFLAELTSYGIINLESLLKIYKKICIQITNLGKKGESVRHIEEYVDCLFRMTKAFQKKGSEKLVDIRKGLSQEILPLLNDIIEQQSALYPGISKKAIFGLRDSIDILKL